MLDTGRVGDGEAKEQLAQSLSQSSIDLSIGKATCTSLALAKKVGCNALTETLRRAAENYTAECELEAHCHASDPSPRSLCLDSSSIPVDGKDSHLQEKVKSRTEPRSAETMKRELHQSEGREKTPQKLPIEDAIILRRLSMNVQIKQGTYYGEKITYINRSWSDFEKKSRGFETEFLLYASSSCLQPLQGVYIPRLLSVYSTDDGFSLDFKLPSDSFWVEASEDMSDELKLKCISAFDAIHDHGVLHGNVELRNMLIGAEGNVTIIDFRNGRTTAGGPIEGVDLPKATEDDIQLEKRLVKFKLDYGESRRHETSLMNRSIGRKGITKSPVELADSKKCDPVAPKIFASKWLEPQNYTSRCFIVPGSDPDFITERIYDFIDEENDRQEVVLSFSKDDSSSSRPSESNTDDRESTKDCSPIRVKRSREESDTESTHEGSPTKKVRMETKAGVDVLHLPYEGYTGPSGATLRRGSLDDDELAQLRVRWIREDNIDRCRRENLDYPFHLQPGQLAFDGSRRPRNRGALRRRKFDKENPKKRFSDALERLKAYNYRQRGDPVISASTDSPKNEDSSDSEDEGPRICSWHEFFAEENRRKAADTARRVCKRPMGATKLNPKASPTKRSILRKHLDQQERLLLQEYDSKQPRAQDDDDDWENRVLSIRKYRLRHAALRAKHRMKSKASRRLLHHSSKAATTAEPSVSKDRLPESQSFASAGPTEAQGDKSLQDDDRSELKDSISRADCV